MTGQDKTVAYSCPFVPAEWIAAHGLRPIRLVPNNGNMGSSQSLTAGMCPYANAFIQQMAADTKADAVVVTTLCDQMRRASEWIARDSDKPVFLLNVPSTWKNGTARDYYAEEIRRLGCFLVRCSGRTPADGELLDAMRRYNQQRLSLLKNRLNDSPLQFSQRIRAFHAGNGMEDNPPRQTQTLRGIPIALIGGPLLDSSLSIFDLAEQAGASIVLDGSETGERAMPGLFDAGRMQHNPFQEMIRAYFDTIPDVSRRPNDLFYTWLERNIQERGIRGIVVLYHNWCDLWHAEISRIKERFALPLIDINMELENGTDTTARTMTRLQALIDMLT